MTLLQTDFLPTKTETFQNFRYLLQETTLKEGVTGYADYLVTQHSPTANVSVDVAAGGCWIQGDDTTRQGVYHQVNDALVNVTGFAAPDATNPRIDQIGVKINDSSITGGSDLPTFTIVTGTPQGGVTLDAPGASKGAIPNGYALLADVLIAANATQILTANIRDRRVFARPIASWGKSIIPATETRTNVAYGMMPTNDAVSVALPQDGLIKILFQGTWQESVLNAAAAAIFIGANQLKVADNDAGSSPVTSTQAAVTSSLGGTSINADIFMASFAGGLFSGGLSTTVGYTGDVTTGQVAGGVGQGASTIDGKSLNAQPKPPFGASTNNSGVYLGGPCYIFAAAGIYTVSVQFKSSSGSVTAKNRKLWVAAEGY